MSLGGFADTNLHLEEFVPVWGDSVNVTFYPDDGGLYAVLDETEYGETHTEILEETVIAPVQMPPKTEGGACKKNPFRMGDDMVENFYIGSLSVVGLFILFRMMQKSRG